MPYIGVSPFNGVRRKHTYTATASQTSFSGAGTEGATLSYTDSTFVDVFQNGVKLGEADYTATSGTAIVLAQGASLNDLVEVVVYDVFSVADTVSKSAGGTFDGNVAMGGTLGVTGVLTGTSLDISGNIDVDGTTNLDAVDIDGAVDMATTLVVAGTATLSGAATVGGVLTANAGVVFNESSADVDFRVESNGNANMLFVNGGTDKVGIGTNDPHQMLGIESASNPAISIVDTTNNVECIIYADDNSVNMGSLSNHTLRFRTNNVERLRLMANGRLENQSPSNSGNVLQDFTVDWRNENSAGIMSSIGCVRTANGSAPGAFVIRTSTNVDTASNSGDGEISEKFRVAANGDLTATDTSIASNSDSRLKENIADFSYDLTKFKSLKTKTFDWKQPALHGNKSGVRGFVAQDIETIDDYWIDEVEVQADSDDYQYLEDKDILYTENSTIPDGKKVGDLEYKARMAKTSKLGQKDAMYVSIIQQLITKIETLETKVAALESA